jgi:biotin transport system substrate-specific component
MLANVTYACFFRPIGKTRALFYDAALIVGGSLFIALCSQLAVGMPVPVTGQTFAVLMIGALYGGRRGALCVLTYIIEGAAGLPVFSHGRGGFAMLFGPTGGYLAGFIVAAYVTGLLAERGWDRRMVTTIVAMLCGNLAIYFLGLLWLCCLMGVGTKVLAIGLYPFLIGDLLKTVLAAILLPAGWKLLSSRGRPLS